MHWLELYGYLGSALIAISLMMSNICKLRWINLVGAGTFATYGLMINAWPVAALNGFIVLINIVHLRQMHRLPAVKTSVRFRVEDEYVQNVLALSLPQVLSLDDKIYIRVEFKGTQPIDFYLIEQSNTVSQPRLAA